MENKVIGCFKSHYSLNGRSILTLEKPTEDKDSYPTSIFNLLLNHNIKELVLVEDSITGLLQASKNCEDLKIKLIFGLKLQFTESIINQDEESLKKRSKYIIFAKNTAGYKNLIKIWSLAAQQGFYYNPCLSFEALKPLWNENLILAVPFYDSFIDMNVLHSHNHVPDFSFAKPTFFYERNNLPFDYLIENRVKQYCTANNFDMLPAQSIYYKSKDDFLAYLSFKCLSSKGSSNKQRTIDSPNFDNLGADTFSFERWLKLNE